MSDSLSTNPVRASEPPDDADREARIEQLLLSGLDHYFAGQFERAISVWTRVVFLERHHDRARAYIERARSALAEHHRESEEFLHSGVSAYNAGDIEKARELLTRALEQGSDTADVFLDRLNRVGTTLSPADLNIDPLPARPIARRRRVTLPPRRSGWTAAALFALFVAATMLLGGLPIGTWLSELQVAAPAPSAQVASEEPLPVVRASETLLARARTLHADGRLRDALGALDRVSIADPFRAEADRLRADIQRDILAAAGIQSSAPDVPGSLP
jgi:tetratricopeptide (TPR) repeat protein